MPAGNAGQSKRNGLFRKVLLLLLRRKPPGPGSEGRLVKTIDIIPFIPVLFSRTPRPPRMPAPTPKPIRDGPGAHNSLARI